MFCSVDCEKSATQKFFQAELDSKMRDLNHRILYEALDICDGSFEKLEQLLKDPKLSRKTIFDFDLSNPTDLLLRYHQLLAFNSLLPGPATVEMDFINDHPVLNLLKTEDERRIAIVFMKRTFRILEYNCIGLNWHTPQRTENEDEKPEVLKRIEVGSGALLFGSLLNHSCAHNIDRIMLDNKVVFYARMPIKKDQQLFISYG
jgi:SET domain